MTTDMKCSPEVVDKFGDNSISIAVMNGHTDIVRYLVNEQGCDTNLKSSKGGLSVIHLV